ncbi:hypothetical protein MSAR_12030 [Mycolicibacterium sarraceniae]|uniref:Uncharacterized protein n=1 Tax=Mycolicibacterium sarraceniae TaxID=1534348 RepID=A0A7I7SM40_9MYCO|nr:hypothetical protein MSAR_12030 [Mycolicibacterium sarraceniae]
MSGQRSLDAFATAADHMIAVEPDSKLVDGWHSARQATGLSAGSRVIGQIPICFVDCAAAVCTLKWFSASSFRSVPC